MNTDERGWETKKLSALICVYQRPEMVFPHPARAKLGKKSLDSPSHFGYYWFMLSGVKVPETLMEAIQYFADPLTCIQFFAELRWDDGAAVCPRCQSKRVSFLTTRLMWKCLDCKKQFS